VSTVNAAAREVSAKIVYYGPGLSGKTTSLKQVYASVRPDTRGQLVSLSTEGDRTLFFDFLPLKIEQVRGLTLRLQLYTVPGQVFYDGTRKLVLNGADGVVFVADSQPLAMDSNLESMSNLETNLADQGIDLASFPFVIQWNKRDLLGALPVEELREELNPRGVPEFETVASRGEGVLPALKEITRLVMKELKARQPRRAAARPVELGDGGSELSSQIFSAAAAPQSAASPGDRPRAAPDAATTLPRDAAAIAREAASRRDGASMQGLSFARLFPGQGAAIAEAELAIRERAFAPAIRTAARAVSELLDALPAEEDTASSRATLLGLDGREYLRLGRLAGRPDGAASEQDALFALYVLVAAMVKFERI
jgi:signal recognition particle receptor subunit beta